MADEAGLADVGTALEGIYNATIRNAVFHSDYAIHDNSMRLLSGTFCSRKDGTNTPLIAFDELGEVTSEAFAFHSALLQLWRRQRTLFTDFRGKFLPYDEAYKGILEYLFEGDVLNGFRAYWPNGTISTCTRTINGQSTAQNIAFNDDDSINFFVGEIFSDRDAFSPCVERGKRPYYGVVPGTDKRPYWPEIRQAYEL
jgi:hypothetical protein